MLFIKRDGNMRLNMLSLSKLKVLREKILGILFYHSRSLFQISHGYPFKIYLLCLLFLLFISLVFLFCFVVYLFVVVGVVSFVFLYIINFIQHTYIRLQEEKFFFTFSLNVCKSNFVFKVLMFLLRVVDIVLVRGNCVLFLFFYSIVLQGGVFGLLLF